MNRVYMYISLSTSAARRRKRGEFLLDKEVSRTKQLMSLRLGGPALGSVLITSSARERGEQEEEGEEKEEEEDASEQASVFLFRTRAQGRTEIGERREDW